MTSFSEGVTRLQEKVGDGKIAARVSFSPEKIGVPQERGTWFSGPNAGVKIEHYTTPGTGAHYLEGTLIDHQERYLEEIASHILSIGGHAAMQRTADEFLADALVRIPKKRGLAGGLASTGEASVSEAFAGVLG